MKIWSWCRIFAVGPPCKHLCGNCIVANRLLQQSALIVQAQRATATVQAPVEADRRRAAAITKEECSRIGGA